MPAWERRSGLALTWAQVALGGSGLPTGSPVLLLALPFASAIFALRHLAEDERSTRTRLGDGDARQVWSKGLQKSLSPGAKSKGPGCAGASPVACRERRGLDHLRRLLRPGVSRGYSCVSGTAAAGCGVASFRWPVSLPYSPTRERCSQSGLGSHLPAAAAAALRSTPAARAARSSHKFWGSPSRLFFNCPQVGRRRLLRTLPSPRPLPLPHHTPTPRRRHATGRSLS